MNTLKFRKTIEQSEFNNLKLQLLLIYHDATFSQISLVTKKKYFI